MWFDHTGRATLTQVLVQDGLKLLDRIPDCADELNDLIDKIEAARPSGTRH